jgi:hypothetical protein
MEVAIPLLPFGHRVVHEIHSESPAALSRGITDKDQGAPHMARLGFVALIYSSSAESGELRSIST